MRRWAIWAANSALFAACCYLAAGIATAALAEALLPARAELAPPDPAAASAERAWSERETILARNLFGAKLSGEQVEAPPVEQDLEETKLPLKLLGTVAGEDESVSNAAIQDLGTRKHQVVFTGQSLDAHPTVIVIAIERRRVVLQNGDKREELRLSDNVTTVKPAPRRQARRRGRAARRARKQPTLAKRVEDMKKDPGGRNTAALYSQARIVPKWEDGQMVGVQLNQVKAGSLYEKIGITSGDVITSVNGIEIDSPQASSRLLSEFTKAREFSIEIQGGRTIDVNSEQLSALLGEDAS